MWKVKFKILNEVCQAAKTPTFIEMATTVDDYLDKFDN